MGENEAINAVKEQFKIMNDQINIERAQKIAAQGSLKVEKNNVLKLEAELFELRKFKEKATKLFGEMK
jgi:hypothetical protein